MFSRGECYLFCSLRKALSTVRSGMVEIPPRRLTTVRLINNFQILEVEEFPDNSTYFLSSPPYISLKEFLYVTRCTWLHRAV